MAELKSPQKKASKDTSINIRMTHQEREQIQILTDAAEMPLTAYARVALLEVVAYFASSLDVGSEYNTEN